ncbi:hypothetical protein MKW94_027407, partial [Papaver nudicaule]|nr:hypothetical protein [Papaver nudicaule]
IQVETKQPATRMSIYGRTHKREAGQRKFNQMETLRKKAEEAGIVESLEQLDGDIYSQTIGVDKRGRYRGVGNCIKRRKSSRVEFSSSSRTDEKLKNLEEHMVVIQQDREELRKANEGLQRNNEETNEKMNKLIDILKLMCPNQDIAAMISNL